jgi:hypothetical protein
MAQPTTAELIEMCDDYEYISEIAKKLKADRHYLTRSQELDWKDIVVLVEENAALKAHILATVRPDDDKPADAEWFAGLPGAVVQQNGKVRNAFEGYIILATKVGCNVQVCIDHDYLPNRWLAVNPTRNAVRHACLSMGHTLKETTN